jgi:hypothetical protein
VIQIDWNSLLRNLCGRRHELRKSPSAHPVGEPFSELMDDDDDNDDDDDYYFALDDEYLKQIQLENGVGTQGGMGASSANGENGDARGSLSGEETEGGMTTEGDDSDEEFRQAKVTREELEALITVRCVLC